jgi:hypothetical protein
MNKEEIAPGIVVYSDVIPDSENLYKDIEASIASVNLKWGVAVVREGDKEHVNTMSRNTSTLGVTYRGGIVNDPANSPEETLMISLNNLFFEHCDPLEQDYKSMYRIDTVWHDTYGILKYGVGQQFTDHVDDHQDYHRRVSTVYYLNDNYKGGEINFPRFGITYKPKANQMIVFPSTYVYNHSVSPVIEGERYAVVSWLR